MIDPKTVEELRGLLAKATPGPWSTHLVDDTTIISPVREIGTTCDSSQTERDDGYNIQYEQMEADAALIVAMRNALPELLDLAASALAAKDKAERERGEIAKLYEQQFCRINEWRLARENERILLERRAEAAEARADKAERERGEARSKAASLQRQAECWAMEARGANATIGEAYQAVTGATGEPGNWNGARPIKDALAEQLARIAALEKALGWYGEQARLARLIHSEGDKGRYALAEDGGSRARATLEGRDG